MDFSSNPHKLVSFVQQFPAVGHPKNDTVLTQGSKSEYFYFVEEGAVKMSRVTNDGKNLILHTFFPGSFFSLLSLVTHDSNEYDFITLLPTTLRKIPRNELLTFLQHNNDALFDLQLRLLKGLNGLLKRIEQSASLPAYNQVASLLLYFSKHLSTELPKITHQEIADWLGLSRENVSIQMKKLESDGVITVLNHQVHIPNGEKLAMVAQTLTVI
jgi:CRP/FNR family transcriptional regulator, cyclic AMP receptor protein